MTLFTILSIVVAGVLLVLAAMLLFSRKKSSGNGVIGAQMNDGLPDASESIPMPPLQKRAWWGLVIGLIVLVSITVILVSEGIGAYREDQGLRLLVAGLFICALVANLALIKIPGRKSSDGDVFMDERDQRIMNQASSFQSAAVIISLAIWAISLSEAFHAQGVIPVEFTYLIFLSTLIVNTISLSGGILIGYWKDGRNG